MVRITCFLQYSSRIATKYSRRKFIDSLRLHVKAGSGGSGLQKYGGIGGSGGDVAFVGEEGISLRDVFKKHPSKRIQAKNGGDSRKVSLLGEKGSNIEIKVPTGVRIRDDIGQFHGEIIAEGDKIIVAKGGLGGDANNLGMKGESLVITLDLRLIADVGLVGFPNAGKSTLLRSLSRATPRVASYPFTTLSPEIGIVNYDDHRIIRVADLPGLIEGAHANIGMGHSFLKHCERTLLLLLVVDIGGFRLSHKYQARTCLETIILLNKELELYKEELLDKPSILVVNKMDKPDSEQIFEKVKCAVKNLHEVFNEVPQLIRPERPLKFERVLSMTARKKVPEEIALLKKDIRDVIDQFYVNDDTENEFKLVEQLKKEKQESGPVLI